MSSLGSGLILSAIMFGLLGLSLTKLGHDKTVAIVFIIGIILAVLGMAPSDPYPY